MRFSSLFSAFLGLALAQPLAAAGTDTYTPTHSPTATETATFTASPSFTASPTATVSPTATPGSGNWSISIANPLIFGSGHSAIWTYQAGPAMSSGLLSFTLPDGLEAPSASNFYVQPSQAGQVSSPNYSGQTASFTVSLAQGSTLSFWYGYNAYGFSVTATASPLGPFIVAAHPSSVTLGAGVVTPVPLPAAIAVVTRTNSPTFTPTPTITATFTPTPTITETYTITQTFTETPLAVAPASGVFSYPNPFDLRKFEKCTFRFAPAASAEIQVFNLLGEPVRKLDAAAIQAAQGWAIWDGRDDYLRRVTGGLYFVRVKTPNETLVRKFTVLH